MIDIQEFLKELRNASDQNELIEKHMKNDHIPLSQKFEYINEIIRRSHYYTGEYIHNSSRLFIFTGMALFELYTDIDVGNDAEKMLEYFDSLTQLNAYNLVMRFVNEDEWNEFRIFLDMANDDVLYNELKITK